METLDLLWALVATLALPFGLYPVWLTRTAYRLVRNSTDPADVRYARHYLQVKTGHFAIQTLPVLWLWVVPNLFHPLLTEGNNSAIYHSRSAVLVAVVWGIGLLSLWHGLWLRRQRRNGQGQ